MLRADAVKAFVFDAYGTLFDVHAPVSQLAAELGERAATLSSLWRAKQLEYSWLRSLMGRYAPFGQITADALDYALEAHNIDDAALRDRLLALYRTLAAYEDTAPALLSLRTSGFRTAILSNGAPDMLEAAVASAGLSSLLERLISVDEVKIYKPSPRVYQHALDVLALSRPEEVAFVSANGWDCSGASAFGFQVIHVNRFGQHGERLGFPPAYEIKNLLELPGLLPQWA